MNTTLLTKESGCPLRNGETANGLWSHFCRRSCPSACSIETTVKEGALQCTWQLPEKVTLINIKLLFSQWTSKKNFKSQTD